MPRRSDKTKNLIIFGTKEIARLAFHYFSHDSDYRVLAFTVDSKYIDSETLLGLPVVPTELLRGMYPPGETAIFVAISYGNLNQNRASVYERFKGWGYEFASYVNSKSSVLTGDVGENVFIMDNVTVQEAAKIGNNVIIGPNAAVCHHTHIKDHNYVGPSACFCGYNVVDVNCVIGAASVIAPRVHIGKFNFIGIGARIFKDTDENEAYTLPATAKSGLAASKVERIGLLRRS